PRSLEPGCFTTFLPAFPLSSSQRQVLARRTKKSIFSSSRATSDYGNRMITAKDLPTKRTSRNTHSDFCRYNQRKGRRRRRRKKKKKKLVSESRIAVRARVVLIVTVAFFLCFFFFYLLLL